jgi:hypothetical protein
MSMATKVAEGFLLDFFMSPLPPSQRTETSRELIGRRRRKAKIARLRQHQPRRPLPE